MVVLLCITMFLVVHVVSYQVLLFHLIVFFVVLLVVCLVIRLVAILGVLYASSSYWYYHLPRRLMGRPLFIISLSR